MAGNLAVTSQSANAIKQYHPPGVLLLLRYPESDHNERLRLLRLGWNLSFLEYVFLPGHTYNSLATRTSFIQDQDNPEGYCRAMCEAFRTFDYSQDTRDILSKRTPHTIFLQHIGVGPDKFHAHIFGPRGQGQEEGCDECLGSPLPCEAYMNLQFGDPSNPKLTLDAEKLDNLQRISQAEGAGGHAFESHWLVDGLYSFTPSDDRHLYSQKLRHPGILRRDLTVMVYRLKTQCNRRFVTEDSLNEDILLYCIHRSRMRRLGKSAESNPGVVDDLGLPPLRGRRNIFSPSVCRKDHTKGFHTGYSKERRSARDFDPVKDYEYKLGNLELDTWATNNSVRSMPGEEWHKIINQFKDLPFKSAAAGEVPAGHFWDYGAEALGRDLIREHADDFSAKPRDEKLKILRQDLNFMRKVARMSHSGLERGRASSDELDVSEQDPDGLDGIGPALEGMGLGPVEAGDANLDAPGSDQLDEVSDPEDGSELQDLCEDGFEYQAQHCYDDEVASGEFRYIEGEVSQPLEGEVDMLEMRLPRDLEAFRLRVDDKLSEWAQGQGCASTSRLMGYFAVSDGKLLDTRLVWDQKDQAKLEGTIGLMRVTGKCKRRAPSW